MNAAAVTTANDTALWLEHLYGHAEHGWLTLFSLDRTTGQRHTDWANVNDLDTLTAAAAQREPTSCVWFGVATRKERLANGQRGGATDCAAIPGFWVDIDIEGPGHKGGHQLAADRPAAHALVASFPLPPTVVIDTGGGLQPWWFFPELEELNDRTLALLASFGATWNRIGTERGIHVDSVFEPARVMRLPGTTNRKDGLARPVKILSANWDLRYGLDDIEAHLDEAPTPDASTDGPAWETVHYIGPQRPGDAYNARNSGSDVLSRAGFTLHRTHHGQEDWVRPGKDARNGHSATVYLDDGHTTIWSDTCAQHWPALQVRRPYDPFGLYAAIEHRGDFTAAREALRAQGYGTPSIGRATSDAAPDGEWNRDPQPIPTRPAPAPIPLESFPAWISDYAESVAEQIQVPVDLPLTIALGALAAVLNGHVKVRATNGWDDGVNLWLAVLARAGAGKSPAASHMLRPARAFEEQRRTMAAGAIREYEQKKRKLERQMKDAEEAFAKLDDASKGAQALRYANEIAELTKPNAGDMFTGDATPEAMVELLVSNNERGAVADTEGTLLSIVAGRYSNKANTEFVLKCWSGDHHDVRRVGRDVMHRLREPRLAIILTLQPKRWVKTLENQDLADVGFPDRFMVSYPAHRKPAPNLRRQSINADARETYEHTFDGIANRAASWATHATLILDDAAIDTYDAMRVELVDRCWGDGDLATMGEFVAKLEASVLRTAGLLHIAHGHSHSEPIDGTTMARAVALGHYWIAHRADMTVDIQAVEDARETLRWIRDNGSLTFTTRELSRGVYAFSRSTPGGPSGKERVAGALELLGDLGWVRATDEWPLGESKQGVKRTIEAHPAAIENRDTSRQPRHLDTESSDQGSESHAEREHVAVVAGVTSKGFQTPFSLSERLDGNAPDQHRDNRDRLPTAPIDPFDIFATDDWSIWADDDTTQEPTP